LIGTEETKEEEVRMLSNAWWEAAHLAICLH
jgi:hypothetical protein